MKEKKNPLADIENEVTQQDEKVYKKQLEKPDRVGKYAVWICVIFFAIGAWMITDGFIDDSPLYHPWYSRLPIIGNKLWTPPVSTQLPVIGQKIHDSGLVKFIALCVGAIIGFFTGKLVSASIRNGAKQDERNKQKLSF